MSSTDKHEEPEQILIGIYAALDEHLIGRRIDVPIDHGLQTFQYEATYPISCQEFHRVIADFIQHLYGTVLKAPWKMSCRDPFTHSLYLMENHYQGTYSQGYMSAWLDASDDRQSPMDTVLNRIAEAVKSMELQEYIHWVFTTHYESLPWEIRCAVAEAWLQQYRSFLLPALQQCSAHRMVKDLPSLIQKVRGIDEGIQITCQHSHS